MRKVLLVHISLFMIGGCATADRAAVLRADSLGAAPNLVLGPDPEVGWIAEELTFRSVWPSVTTGYRFSDPTVYSEVNLDDQAFFEFDGGAFLQSTESIRTGVFVR